MDNTQLCHWGIKGMKWGVRRYQNSDGSLTPAGRKRYGDGGDSNSSVKGGKPGSSSKLKSVSEMSDSELRAAVARLQLEKQYRDLLPREEPKVSAGIKFIKAVGKTIGPAIGEASKTLIKDYIIKAGKEKLGLNDEKDSDKVANEKLKTKVELLTNKKKLEELTNPKPKSELDDIKDAISLMKAQKEYEDLLNPSPDVQSYAQRLKETVEILENKEKYKKKTGKDYDED